MCSSGGFTAAGWDVVAAHNQADLSRRQGINSSKPDQLTRTLFVPRHDETTSNLSIFDFSLQYTEAVGDKAIGSASYIVAVAQIPKPNEGDDSGVYQVDFTEATNPGDPLGAKSIKVRPQPISPMLISAEANVVPGSSEDDPESVMIKVNKKEHDFDKPPQNIKMSTSYPIAPTKFDKKEWVHPYFSFNTSEIPDEFLQWQIHPVSQGRLRYTLVRVYNPQSRDTTSSNPEVPLESDVVAIYQDIGNGISLPLAKNEGILLLSDMGAELEATVLASALGMLEQLRRLSKGVGNSGLHKKILKKKPFGFVKDILKKK